MLEVCGGDAEMREVLGCGVVVVLVLLLASSVPGEARGPRGSGRQAASGHSGPCQGVPAPPPRMNRRG